ncbi:DUF2290 domain-containing protein [Spirosoma foliorum]|uniref:DUF2290 domain-containing protein n=1 Tax=Spirosoma foliorum TaxID=2710596 RepID=A0A7G5H2Z5_9BACT|nr:DUF2290 domain-containing protein [Spirosoma foliorum]QMW05487.1 DUF2290 domain-containing protein [Spirosoma foliorum]
MNDLDFVLDRLSKINNIFSDFILETNYIRNNNTISWPDYKPGSHKFLYAREYEYLLKLRQYSFLFSDKSFIQCYYNFGALDGKSMLKEVKLCYYPYPVLLKQSLNDYEDLFDNTEDDNLKQYYYDLYLCMSDEFGFNIHSQIDNAKINFEKKYGYNWEPDTLRGLLFDKIYKNTNYSHFRMDYDYAVTTHQKCELQFGAVKSIRFPIDRVLDPFLFFDLVFKSFLKDDYDNLIKYDYKKHFILGKRYSILIDNFKENNIFKTLK